jgi:hypothetical protein
MTDWNGPVHGHEPPSVVGVLSTSYTNGTKKEPIVEVMTGRAQQGGRPNLLDKARTSDCAITGCPEQRKERAS